MHSRVTEGDAEPALGDEPAPDACVRLLLPERCSGAILGRGGTLIQALRQATGCHIRLAPYSPADALLAISG